MKKKFREIDKKILVEERKKQNLNDNQETLQGQNYIWEMIKVTYDNSTPLSYALLILQQNIQNIKAICDSPENQQNQIFGVMLFINNQWVMQMVDDKIPKNFKQFICNEKVMWPIILEKAIKLATQNNTQLFNTEFYLKLLTGCPIEYVKDLTMIEKDDIIYIESQGGIQIAYINDGKVFIKGVNQNQTLTQEELIKKMRVLKIKNDYQWMELNYTNSQIDKYLQLWSQQFILQFQIVKDEQSFYFNIMEQNKYQKIRILLFKQEEEDIKFVQGFYLTDQFNLLIQQQQGSYLLLCQLYHYDNSTQKEEIKCSVALLPISNYHLMEFNENNLNKLYNTLAQSKKPESKEYQYSQIDNQLQINYHYQYGIFMFYFDYTLENQEEEQFTINFTNETYNNYLLSQPKLEEQILKFKKVKNSEQIIFFSDTDQIQLTLKKKEQITVMNINETQCVGETQIQQKEISELKLFEIAKIQTNQYKKIKLQNNDANDYLGIKFVNEIYIFLLLTPVGIGFFIQNKNLDKKIQLVYQFKFERDVEHKIEVQSNSIYFFNQKRTSFDNNQLTASIKFTYNDKINNKKYETTV